MKEEEEEVEDIETVEMEEEGDEEEEEVTAVQQQHATEVIPFNNHVPKRILVTSNSFNI